MLIERVFVHYDKLHQFMIRELFATKADQLGWVVVMNHIILLPQYSYRSDLSQPLHISTHGVQFAPSDLEISIDSIPHIIERTPDGRIKIAPLAMKELSSFDSNPIIIVRKPTTLTPFKTDKNKKDFEYANNLFAGPASNFYSFHEGNSILNEMLSRVSDMDEFCEWRLKKKRQAIPTSAAALKKEYEIFKAPEIDLSSMKAAPQAPAPSYRSIKLKKGDLNDS